MRDLRSRMTISSLPSSVRLGTAPLPLPGERASMVGAEAAEVKRPIWERSGENAKTRSLPSVPDPSASQRISGSHGIKRRQWCGRWATMDRLKGKVAIITGAGSGIGRAGALLFAAEGAAVAVADINPESGQRVAAKIQENGGRSGFVQTDVGDAASVRNLVARVEETFGGVDILFTNAADVPLINFQDACALNLDEEVFDRIHRVILRGVFLCAKYAGPAMIRRGGGAMVFTATVDAQVGCSGLDAYTAAKGGVVALTRSLAAGLARYRIRVNAIAPGFVATEPQAVFMDHPQRRAG